MLKIGILATAALASLFIQHGESQVTRYPVRGIEPVMTATPEDVEGTPVDPEEVGGISVDDPEDVGAISIDPDKWGIPVDDGINRNCEHLEPGKQCLEHIDCQADWPSQTEKYYPPSTSRKMRRGLSAKPDITFPLPICSTFEDREERRSCEFYSEVRTFSEVIVKVADVDVVLENGPGYSSRRSA